MHRRRRRRRREISASLGRVTFSTGAGLNDNRAGIATRVSLSLQRVHTIAVTVPTSFSILSAHCAPPFLERGPVDPRTRSRLATSPRILLVRASWINLGRKKNSEKKNAPTGHVSARRLLQKNSLVNRVSKNFAAFPRTYIRTYVYSLVCRLEERERLERLELLLQFEEEFRENSPCERKHARARRASSYGWNKFIFDGINLGERRSNTDFRLKNISIRVRSGRISRPVSFTRDAFHRAFRYRPRQSRRLIIVNISCLIARYLTRTAARLHCLAKSRRAKRENSTDITGGWHFCPRNPRRPDIDFFSTYVRNSRRSPRNVDRLLLEPASKRVSSDVAARSERRLAEDLHVKFPGKIIHRGDYF